MSPVARTAVPAIAPRTNDRRETPLHTMVSWVPAGRIKQEIREQAADLGEATVERWFGGIRVLVAERAHGLAHQHVVVGFLFVQGVVDVEDGAAGVAPDVLDVLGLQGLDEDFGAAQFGRPVAGRGGGLEFGLGDFHDQPL